LLLQLWWLELATFRMGWIVEAALKSCSEVAPVVVLLSSHNIQSIWICPLTFVSCWRMFSCRLEPAQCPPSLFAAPESPLPGSPKATRRPAAFRPCSNHSSMRSNLCFMPGYALTVVVVVVGARDFSREGEDCRLLRCHASASPSRWHPGPGNKEYDQPMLFQFNSHLPALYRRWRLQLVGGAEEWLPRQFPSQAIPVPANSRHSHVCRSQFPLLPSIYISVLSLPLLLRPLSRGSGGRMASQPIPVATNSRRSQFPSQPIPVAAIPSQSFPVAVQVPVMVIRIEPRVFAVGWGE
jgi:hypothetical protein